MRPRRSTVLRRSWLTAWHPLANHADAVLLLARLVLGAVMIYYGWPKVRDLEKNANDFAQMGFRPGVLWGTIVALVEFGGGIAVTLGLVVWLAAALFGFEMLVGTIWKITKAGKGFPDYSYDLLALALTLVLLAFGPGSWALSSLLGSVSRTNDAARQNRESKP